MKSRKTLSGWLSNRYQLVIRNEEDLAEKSTFSFSYAKLIALCAILLLTLVACSLTLSTTILSRWLNPAYLEQENKKELVKLATAVDTLEQQTTQQKKFIALLQSIIAGKEPPQYALPKAEAKQAEEETTPYSPAQLASADASLRSEFEGSEASLIAAYSKSVDDLQALLFFTPINNGIITTPFKQNIGHYGVDIVAKDKEPIKCIADGVVVLSTWTVETGWVMVIQHDRDLVSIYKHNAALLKKVGSFVKAGDVIAIMGNSGELSTGPHLHFELWYQGSPVNPEHFITF